MNRFVRIFAVSWAALIFAFAQHAEIIAQDVVTSAPQNPEQKKEGVLVLQDGGVLVGRIKRQGDRYVLTGPRGEMQIAAANVMLAGDSLQDAYVQRRQLIRPTAEAHLSLTEWCLRYGLIDQAKHEMADAKRLDARHARLALLERRLAVAVESRRKLQRPRPTAKSRPPSEPSPETASPVSVNLSSEVVEKFTRKVQPVLVNNCTESGCHQRGGKEAFQLDRAILHGMANRRSTMNNLAAAIALVDRARPELSPLLAVPRRTHGGMQDPIFGPRTEQAFAHLVEWVALVAPSESTVPTEFTPPDATIAMDKSEPGATRLVSPVMKVPKHNAAVTPEESGSGVIQASAVEPVDAMDAALMPASHERNAIDASPKSHNLRLGAQLQKWHPKDPFDPEIFNRQHSSPRPSASAAPIRPPADER